MMVWFLAATEARVSVATSTCKDTLSHTYIRTDNHIHKRDMITNWTFLLKTCISNSYYNPSSLEGIYNTYHVVDVVMVLKTLPTHQLCIYIFSAPPKLTKWPKCLLVINLLSQSFAAWIDIPNKKSSLVWRTKSNLYAWTYKKFL